MEIRLTIPDARKALSLIEFIRSFSPTTQIHVLPETVGAASAAPKPAESQPPKLSSFLAKHNGAIPDLDVETFETYIAQTRNEWEPGLTLANPFAVP